MSRACSRTARPTSTSIRSWSATANGYWSRISRAGATSFTKAKSTASISRTPATRFKNILRRTKELEGQGYEFQAAEASFELLIQEALGKKKKNFNLVGFRVIDEKRKEGEAPISEATIMVQVDGVMEHAAAMGNGPVNALDQALRRALTKFYPSLKQVELLGL